MADCQMCGEPMTSMEEKESIAKHRYLIVHRECGLRSALGGIGHHVDHYKWCVQAGDPDMGLSYRESARRVDALVAGWGIDAVVASSVNTPGLGDPLDAE